jgi:ribulose-phosphate 3-epimerase
MINDPDRYLKEFADAGADIITVHAEATVHLHRTLQLVTTLGCKVGVAINPATSVEAIHEMLPFIDQVLVMTVNPGFGSQRFIETMTAKIRRMRRLMDELCPLGDLQVDGGIHAANIADVVYSGANVIVAGSAVFNEKATPETNLARLRAQVQENL